MKNKLARGLGVLLCASLLTLLCACSGSGSSTPRYSHDNTELNGVKCLVDWKIENGNMYAQMTFTNSCTYPMQVKAHVYKTGYASTTSASKDLSCVVAAGDVSCSGWVDLGDYVFYNGKDYDFDVARA